MIRLRMCLVMCLLAVAGCSFALEEKQWFQASAPAHTPSRVTLSVLSQPNSKHPQYKHPPIIRFHDSDGTTWQVYVAGNKPRDWFVNRIEPEGQRVPVPLVEVPVESAASQPLTHVVEEQRALAIARQAVEANDTWADRATYEVQKTEDGWSVTVWREPRVIGGDRLILIDRNGKVTSYYRGM